MEKWHNYKKNEIQIEIINCFEGGNRELNVFFTNTKNEKQKLYFDFVFDFRYAIENAFLNRDFFRKEYSSIYIVENSDYIKYFSNQVCGTYSIENLNHYIIFDSIDSGLEILTTKEPVLLSNTLNI